MKKKREKHSRNHSMDLYDLVDVVGEGTYGRVMKCKVKKTGSIVAIKKLKDKEVSPMILREIQLLKKLNHDNIVSLIRVFAHKGKLHLVMEYMSTSLLKEIEKYRDGMPRILVQKYVYQLLKALEYLHFQNIVHRDIKPENLLISENGVLKLADFGFARRLDEKKEGKYTEYVATRWYRAPELLVGQEYGKPIDVWAVGCLVIEMMTNDVMFQGDSDIEQLQMILNICGELTEKQMAELMGNPKFRGLFLPLRKNSKKNESSDSIRKHFFNMPKDAISFIECCCKPDPHQRLPVEKLLNHPFVKEGKEWYEITFQSIVESDSISKKISKFVSKLNVTNYESSNKREKVSNKRKKRRKGTTIPKVSSVVLSPTKFPKIFGNLESGNENQKSNKYRKKGNRNKRKKNESSGSSTSGISKWSTASFADEKIKNERAEKWKEIDFEKQGGKFHKYGSFLDLHSVDKENAKNYESKVFSNFFDRKKFANTRPLSREKEIRRGVGINLTRKGDHFHDNEVYLTKEITNTEKMFYKRFTSVKNRPQFLSNLDIKKR